MSGESDPLDIQPGETVDPYAARLVHTAPPREIDSPFPVTDWGPARFPVYYRMCAERGVLPFRPADAESAS